MAISAKLNWQPSSIPTAEDFNRIEQNIINLQNEKQSTITTLGVRQGGTGASNASTARLNLGLGDAAVLNILKEPIDENGNKVATLKTYSNGSSGYLYLENGYLINWGTVYLSEDSSENIVFPSMGQSLGYLLDNGKIAGVVVTSMIGENNVLNYDGGRSVFVYENSSNGLKIYNDGAGGYVQWLVIGQKG